MWNYSRNPILIIVFTAIGMIIRYFFFYFISTLNRVEPKNIWFFSEGFKQIVYNLLLTFLIFTGFIFYLVYDTINM